MSREIRLSQGKVAIVDDEDFAFLSAHKWYALRDLHTFYGRRTIYHPDGKKTMESIHRVVLGRKLGRLIVDGLHADHINGDGLDNRRSNLRETDRGQNLRNQQRRKWNTTSRYLGVNQHKRDGKWHARICIPDSRVHIGTFDTERSAMMARERYIADHPDLRAKSNLPKGGAS